MIVSLMFWRDMNSNINTYLHLLDTSLAKGYVIFLYLLNYNDNSVRDIDNSITYVLIISIIMFYNLSCVLYNNNYFIDSMYAHLLFRMFGYILFHLTVIKEEKNMTIIFVYFTNRR